MFNLYRLSRSIKLREFLAPITVHSLSVRALRRGGIHVTQRYTRVVVKLSWRTIVSVSRRSLSTAVHIVRLTWCTTKQRFQERKLYLCVIASFLTDCWIFFPSLCSRFFWPTKQRNAWIMIHILMARKQIPARYGGSAQLRISHGATIVLPENPLIVEVIRSRVSRVSFIIALERLLPRVCVSCVIESVGVGQSIARP